MKKLTKADIIAANDLPLTKMVVKEWEGEIYLRNMTGNQRAEFEEAAAQLKTEKQGFYKGFVLLFLSMAIVDESGNTLFTADDLDVLGAKNYNVLERVFKKASGLNAVTNKDVEALAKN